MSLKDLYQNWNFRPLAGVGNGDDPVKQSEGKVAVDYLPNTYQKEVKNRTPNDKVVLQATGDDATKGTFNTTSAFKYYSTLFSSPLKTFKSKIVHLYNAQGNASEKYITSNKVKDTPGALYNTNS